MTRIAVLTTGALRTGAFAVMAAGLALSPAKADQQAAPPAWPLSAEAPLVPDPTVTWGKLANGVRYVIMPNDTPPGRVSLRLLIRAGSLMESEDQRGLAHFLEHMSFKGSENMAPGQLVEYLQRLGMAFGPDTNARTGFWNTVYQLELPGNDTKLLQDGIGTLSEIDGRLLLLPDQIEPERGVILSEERLRNVPRQRQFEASINFLLPDALLGKRMPIGLDGVIKGAGRDRFARFYKDFYTPDRSVVLVVGDVKPADIVPMIEAKFGAFVQAADAPADPDYGSFAERAPDAMLFSDPGISTSVSINKVRPYDKRPDGLDRWRDHLVEAVAQAMLSRRLESLSLKPDAPFTDAGAGSSPFRPVANLVSMRLVTTPEKWKDALAAGEQELRRALEFGFSAPELKEELGIIRNELAAAAASAATRSSADLADGLIDAVDDGTIYTDPKTDLALFDELSSTFTTDEVLAKLRAIWGPGAPPLLVLAGPMQLADPKAEILAAYDQSQTVAVAASDRAATPVFAYDDVGPSSGVTERGAVSDLGITDIVFGNGVRLDLKQTDFAADTIQVAIRFGSGRTGLPADKPGLDMLAGTAFIDGGLGKQDNEELTRIFAGRQVGIDFIVSDASTLLLATTTKKDLADQLKLMAAYVTDPGYRPEAMDRYRQRIAARYAQLAAVPHGVIAGAVETLLHSGDTRFGIPPQDVAEARTLDDLRAWLEPALRTGPMQVAIIGDVDPAVAEDLVGRTFGALPPRGTVTPAAPLSVVVPAATAEPVVFRHQGPKDQALSLVYWPTTDQRDTKRAAGLDLLAEVIADRLLHQVREREGATYSPDARSYQSLVIPGYGYLMAALDVDVNSAERLNELTRDVAQSIVKEGITQDEFDRAVRPQLAQAEAALKTNEFWFYGAMIGMHQFPDRVDAARQAIANIKAQTVQTVDALAKDYLVPDRALSILVLPEPVG